MRSYELNADNKLGDLLPLYSAGCRVQISIPLTTEQLSTLPESIFQWVQRRRPCFWIMFTYGSFSAWELQPEFVDGTDSDFWKSPCTDFLDIIMSVFSVVLPEGLNLMDIQYWFSSISIMLPLSRLFWDELLPSNSRRGNMLGWDSKMAHFKHLIYFLFWGKILVHGICKLLQILLFHNTGS